MESATQKLESLKIRNRLANVEKKDEGWWMEGEERRQLELVDGKC